MRVLRAAGRAVRRASREHGLVLSPHNLDPMPRDGQRPNEQDILDRRRLQPRLHRHRLAATFADELLDWWAERLETDCIVDPDARLLRRPALDRPRARDGRELPPAARPRLQRRLLEPARRGRSAATRRPLARQRRRAAAAVPLQRLRPARAAPALQAPEPHRACATIRELAELCARLRRRSCSPPAPTRSRAWPYTYATTALRDRRSTASCAALYRKLRAPRRVRRARCSTRGGERGRSSTRLNAPADGRRRARRHALPRGAVRRARRTCSARTPTSTGADAAGYLGWARVLRARRGPDRRRCCSAEPRADRDAPAAAPATPPRADAAARRQRRRLPALRARRRRGRAPGDRARSTPQGVPVAAGRRHARR